jgi:tetratricopeptide (TPR) repeat protein
VSGAFVSGGEEERFREGASAQQAGRLDEAEARYRAALAANPNYLSALLALGRLLELRERPAEALDPYVRAVALRPNLTDALLGSARCKLATGDVAGGAADAASARELAAAAGSRTQQAEALSLQGEALLARGDEASAATALEQAIELDPGSSRSRLALARLRVRHGSSRDVVDALGRAVEYERDPRRLLEAAELLVSVSQLPAAVQALERAAALLPGDDAIESALAEAYLGNDNPAAAARLAEKVIARGTAPARALAARARSELAMGRPEQAVVDLATLEGIAPGAPATAELAGDVAVAQGRPADAERAYRLALSGGAPARGASLGLARILMARGAWLDAVTVLEPLSAGATSPRAVRPMLADAYLRASRPDLAIPLLSELALETPADAEANSAVARLALEHPNTLEPVTVLRHARLAFDAADGALTRFRVVLVDALLLNGERDEAAAVVEAGLRLAPNQRDLVERQRRIRSR